MSPLEKIKLFRLKNDATVKVGCVLLMIVVPLLLHAKFGRNDHREDAPHFIQKNDDAAVNIFQRARLYPEKHV